jgi:hypothetical protein
MAPHVAVRVARATCSHSSSDTVRELVLEVMTADRYCSLHLNGIKFGKLNLPFFEGCDSRPPSCLSSARLIAA